MPDSRGRAHCILSLTGDNGEVTTPVTRREARAADLLSAATAPVRHARARRAARIRMVFATAASAVLAVGAVAAITGAVLAPALVPDETLAAASTPTTVPVPLPQAVDAIPAPTVAIAPATVDVCGIPAFTDALSAGDDAGAIAAAGGADAFRRAVASGAAPCVSLADPARVWLVVNKTHPFDPIDYAPDPLVQPDVREITRVTLRADAASALTEMFAAAAASGAGELALDSGYRSYRTQRTTYERIVSAKGRDEADMVSARPGYSEHQSGLAADVTACPSGCLGLDSFAGTSQQQWISDHSWEHGWIVRYSDGQTATTGYSPEAWHLRFIGRELAAAYHQGGFTSLEEFFGMPAAPTYG